MNPATQISTASQQRFPRLAAACILLLTAVLALAWSHNKLLSQDEMFVLQTDSVSSVRQLIHIQHVCPISLDPLVYHLLAHAATKLFGQGAFALRLPSLLGYLLMQVCLYLFVRRNLGERAAVIAMAFPALTATLFYAAEARPYGLLLGLYALTLLSWQAATSQAETSSTTPPTSRTAALITLTLSIALTLNAHYFGILLLIPLWAAELVRSLQRRRLDWPVLFAIVLGMAAIVFALPFQKAAGQFRKHYYNGGTVGLRTLTQSYRSLFMDYTHASLQTQHLLAIAFVLFAIALTIGCLYRWKTQTLGLPHAQAVFVLVLAALPFFGFLLARFVTHSIEVRYVLGAIIGIAILIAAVLAPTLRNDRVFAFTVALLFVAIVASGILRSRASAEETRQTLATFTLTPSLKAQLLANPDERLYMQSLGHFEVAQYYTPDPDLRSRLTLVYDAAQEIRWDGHDTHALTAQHMLQFTTLPIVSFDQLSHTPGQHTFVLFHTGWDWTDQAFAQQHAVITPLGTAFEGDAAAVQFVP